jgi:antitoxin ParD1/3/4
MPKGGWNMSNAKAQPDSLPPDVDEAIRRRVTSGRYASQEDVIRAALRALERDEEEKARKLAVLDAAIERGIADAEAGRVHPAEDVFAELRAKYVWMAEDNG